MNISNSGKISEKAFVKKGLKATNESFAVVILSIIYFTIYNIY